MRLGVNIPNFGPGTDPGVVRAWASTSEGLGYDLLMVSDHLVLTPDVARQYPAPFYEPFTTLAWLAGATSRVRLGTTVLIVPYRHPLETARMAANLADLSGGRFVLGVGVGWAREEFAALGVPFARRGALTDEYLQVIRTAWAGEADYRAGSVPVWVGGTSDAALRRTVRFGDAWHPLRFRREWLDETLPKLQGYAGAAGTAVPGFAPRILLRVTGEPVAGRRMGEGTVEEIVADLAYLRSLGATDVVLDPFAGDPEETRRPTAAWRALAAVADAWTQFTRERGRR